MPILEVEVVGALPPKVEVGLAQQLADATGEVLRARPGGTWVKLTTLPAEHYAESGGAQDGVQPVFVTVLKRDVADAEGLSHEVAALAQAIARVCDRPAENVHILYLPPARGRMAFGGQLVR